MRNFDSRAQVYADRTCNELDAKLGGHADPDEYKAIHEAIERAFRDGAGCEREDIRDTRPVRIAASATELADLRQVARELWAAYVAAFPGDDRISERRAELVRLGVLR